MSDARPIYTNEKLVVLAGSANTALAESVAAQLGVRLGPYGTARYPDGEIAAAVYDVRDLSAVVVQPTPHPAGENLLELLLVADACRRGGARSITAIVPYLGYARQDHRSRPGQALGMRVVAEMLDRARIDHLIAVDLHAASIEGFFSMPLEHVSAAPVLAEAVRPHAGRGAVVVAPDFGSARLARAYAQLLELPMAIVQKTRLNPLEVSTAGVIGDVRGLRPIVVDDMISTGATIEAALVALRAERAADDVTVAATHLVVPESLERLQRAGVQRLFVTDSLPPPARAPFTLAVARIAPLLAEAVRRACGGR